jgi:hypothetical protein
MRDGSSASCSNEGRRTSQLDGETQAYCIREGTGTWHVLVIRGSKSIRQGWALLALVRRRTQAKANTGRSLDV